MIEEDEKEKAWTLGKKGEGLFINLKKERFFVGFNNGALWKNREAPLCAGSYHFY